MSKNIDSMDLRPAPDGITKISKKTKMVVAIAGMTLIGTIAIGLTYEDKPKAKSDVVQSKEPIPDTDLMSSADSLDKVFKQIPNGRTDLDAKPVDAIDTKNVDIKLDTPTDDKKVDLTNAQPVVEQGPTPEQIEADRIKQMKAQLKQQALMAPTKVAGVASNKEGALPSAITSTVDTINNRLNSMMQQQGQGQAGAGAVQAMAQQAQQQDDQNKQLRKEQFMLSAQNSDLSKTNYLPAMKQMPLSKYEVKAGFVMPAVMLTGANSDLPGQLIAQVRENVYDTVAGDFLLIPQGSKLIGTYDSQVAYGQSRLLILWNRLIMPDGGSYNLGGMQGADVSGYAGVEDQVSNHYLKIYGSAMAMSVITAGVSLTQPKQQGANSTPSTQETMAQALGQALGSTTNAILNKNINIQPTLEIRQGMKFNVVITKDMIFPKEYKY